MKQLPPLYTLDHGIIVVGEYAARGKNRYVRLRIRPHPFFPDAPIIANGILVRKNRVVLAAKLGRALLPSEHAHHDDEDPKNDSDGNIELLTASDHNKHHKTGAKHSAESKQKISQSLRRAYAEGRHARPLGQPQKATT